MLYASDYVAPQVGVIEWRSSVIYIQLTVVDQSELPSMRYLYIWALMADPPYIFMDKSMDVVQRGYRTLKYFG